MSALKVWLNSAFPNLSHLSQHKKRVFGRLKDETVIKLKHLKNYLKFKVKVFSHFFICPLLGFDQLLRRFDKFLPGL